MLLLAHQYIAVDPLSVIFSMIVDCCLALFCLTSSFLTSKSLKERKKFIDVTSLFILSAFKLTLCSQGCVMKNTVTHGVH